MVDGDNTQPGGIPAAFNMAFGLAVFLMPLWMYLAGEPGWAKGFVIAPMGLGTMLMGIAHLTTGKIPNIGGLSEGDEPY